MEVKDQGSTLYEAAKALHEFLAPGVRELGAREGSKPSPQALIYASLHRELGDALKREAMAPATLNDALKIVGEYNRGLCGPEAKREAE